MTRKAIAIACALGIVLSQAHGGKVARPSSPHDRNLAGTARVVLDSVATAQAIQTELGVVPPLTIVGPNLYADGGSFGGAIVGSRGDTVLYAVSNSGNGALPVLYIGADHFRSAGAVPVEPSSLLEQAIAAAINLYSGNHLPFVGGKWVISSTNRD